MKILFLCIAIFPLGIGAACAEVFKTEHHTVEYEILTEDLEHPWGMAFLPDGQILVTEKPGRLRLIKPDGELLEKPITGLPNIQSFGQGGLLDVALHPQFSENRWVYIAYTEIDQQGNAGTTVARGQLRDHALHNLQIIFRLAPKTRSSFHFGSRLIFDTAGYLFITTGDRGAKNRSQDLFDHAGSLIRLHADGRIPQDNPFADGKNARAEIFSYGHRNMQGAALHPDTGLVWTHEHGPQGGDELNIPKAGINYGWPVITYGVNYGSGSKIGEGTHKAGMAQPRYYWIPSIAPSGMTFYNGQAFPKWQGNLFIGSLKFQLLVRLELDGAKVVKEERMLDGELGRMRDVRQGPDGLLYLLTDDYAGLLVRLKPASNMP